MIELAVPSASSIGWARELRSFNADEDEMLDRAASVAIRHLPIEVTDSVESLRAERSRHGALLVRGVPVDDVLPPTPIADEHPRRPKQTQISEGVLLGIGRLLGEPVAYAAEKHGVLVQDVFPVPSEHDSPSNASSSIELGLHTELVFSRAHPDRPMHEASPDFLLLLCLRPDPSGLAVTTVAEARTLCGLVGKEVEVLRRPVFELRAPYSFTRDGDGARPWIGPVPLVEGPADAPRIAFDLACGVRARSTEGERAIDALRRAGTAASARIDVRLDRGDLLVIDNRHCAHGRSSFPAGFSGTDRWIQRTYVRRSLEGISHRGSTYPETCDGARHMK